VGVFFVAANSMMGLAFGVPYRDGVAKAVFVGEFALVELYLRRGGGLPES
jgi:hypothetical protein